MVAEERQEEQKSYQRALRVIGRYLDSEPSYHMSVAQTADGFTVRSHPTPQRADEIVKHFEWDRLEDLDLFYAGGRNVARRRPRHQGLWERFPCGHERALRKLGAILDEKSASSLSIDEMDEGIDVSYMCSDSGESGQPAKQQKVFTADDLCS